MKPSTRRQACFGALLVALVGLSPLMVAAPVSVRVMDLGAPRVEAADAEEISETVRDAGEVAKRVLVWSGRPEWVPIVDVVVRVLSLILAWTIRPKDGKT